MTINLETIFKKLETRKLVLGLKVIKPVINLDETKPTFSDQFEKIFKRYKKVGYNMDIMRQSACLVVNPIMVDSHGFLFYCTTVGQVSYLMKALT